MKNIQVFRSLMMKKLCKPLIPHQTFIMLIIRIRTLSIRGLQIIHKVIQGITTALKYLDQRSDSMPTGLLLFKNSRQSLIDCLDLHNEK